mgnify:CR=1 FL=1
MVDTVEHRWAEKGVEDRRVAVDAVAAETVRAGGGKEQGGGATGRVVGAKVPVMEAGMVDAVAWTVEVATGTAAATKGTAGVARAMEEAGMGTEGTAAPPQEGLAVEEKAEVEGGGEGHQGVAAKGRAAE